MSVFANAIRCFDHSGALRNEFCKEGSKAMLMLTFKV